MIKSIHINKVFLVLIILLFPIANRNQAQTIVDPVLTLNASGSADQDDMCIWIHPTNRSLSTIIASDKEANKLFVYSLDGTLLQTVNVQYPGNIDIRYNFLLSGVPTDIIGFNSRNTGNIVLYKIDRTTRQLSSAGSFAGGLSSNYGFCLYRSKVSGKTFAFLSQEGTAMKQFELVDNSNGTIGGNLVRSFINGSGDLTEGLVCDDELGYFFAANEGEGIYRYNAEPNGSTSGTLIAAVGSNGLSADVEGLTIYYTANGNGYLIASSQGNNRFLVFNRQSPHTYVKYFTVSGVGSTDGIDLINMNLNSTFTKGMFLCHDGTGSPFVIRGSRWEDVGLTVDTSYWNPRYSPFSFLTNTFAVIGDYANTASQNPGRVADMVKSWNPEYIITGGDNHQDDVDIDENIGRHYSKFIFPYNGSYPPGAPDKNRFWVSMGNHDYDDNHENEIKNYLPYLVPNTYYDKVIGDVHFFFLDSEQFYQYSGAQKTWFDNAVANSTARWRIAVFHRPSYTSGGGGNVANENNMRAWPLAENNFHLVFSGHIHNMEHLTVPGEQTHYIVQGAGGRSIYTFENNPSPATRVWGQDTEFGACKVIVTSSNLIIEFWSTDGTTNTLEHSFTLNNPIANTFQLSVNVQNGWNIVSIPGLHPVNQNVLTWWTEKDPAAGVFEFNGTYSLVTTAVPGTGYWMKNLGAQVYNTGDEWPAEGIQIVSNNPINATAGWNLFGVYQNIIEASNLTTSPAGLIEGPVYAFSGTYEIADTLLPGHAYWIKLTGDGQINIP
jgi:myo-inositol-hexaphosphate 3-phosphohydrolase